MQEEFKHSLALALSLMIELVAPRCWGIWRQYHAQASTVCQRQIDCRHGKQRRMWNRSHGRNLAFVSTSLLYVERWPTIFPHYVMTRMFNFVFFLFFFHGILNNFLDAIALVKRVTITCMHLVLVAEFNGTKHIKYWPYFQIKKQQPMALTSDLDVNCTTA